MPRDPQGAGTRTISYWVNRFKAWWFRWPSWRVVYADGYSRALRYDDARTRCEMFDGLRVEYCRDNNGDLLPIPPHAGEETKG